jgi:DNA mismatch repair protein MutS2
MDSKTITTLEFPKILQRLADYAAFSASKELALKLKPSIKMQEVERRLTRTREARHLLSVQSGVSVGAARDVRPQVELAQRGGVLEAEAVLAVKHTLVAARRLLRTLDHQEEDYPTLETIAAPMHPPSGLVDSISKSLDDNGEIPDNASQKLSKIRREMKISHDRLLSRMQRIITDPKTVSLLQEPIITQRNGRYVVPLRADFKRKMKSVVHDQSSSGATLFVEPLAVVELNNAFHELQLAEKEEERRILAALSEMIGQYAGEINALVNSLAEFDLALMCARYADDLRASEPELVPFRERKGSHPGSTIQLYHARHPLLDPEKVVAIDVDLYEKTYSVVITGPNTGGKTVTLKTVGLLVLMTQSGMHIPAQSGSKLSLFKNVFADIGDEQSIEQSLSTFSAHITNIVRILKRADWRCLVLFDELGAGTDPEEGAALARALLVFMVRRRITNLVATHYPSLKAFAHTTKGVVNASMEFDVKELRPTYHLNIGLPGRSNALLIAERLGLQKSVLEEARGNLNPEDLQTEDLLDEIHRQRDRARQAYDEAEQAQQEAEEQRDKLADRLAEIEEERLDVLEKARQQAAEETEAVRDEMEQVRRDLLRARKPVDDLKPVEKKVEKIEKVVDKPVRRKKPEPQMRPADPATLKPGKKVFVRSLKMKGELLSISGNEAEVQLGALRLRVKLNELQVGDQAQEEETLSTTGKAKQASGSRQQAKAPEQIFHASPGIELDLRGQRVDDALDKLEDYLDQAFLAGLPSVRIIHGLGTGAVKQAVRKALRHAKQVKTWKVGKHGEGGDGVTVAYLDVD